MPPKFVDAHTHVQFAAFENDWRDAIKRAKNQGVALVNVGTQKDTSRRAIEVAEHYHHGVYATVGLHPIHTAKSFHDPHELGGGEAARSFTSRGEEFDFEYYRKLALNSKVLAIGECGLDYYRIDPNAAVEKEKQKEALLAQIELAKEVHKPLMIHCREAFSDLVDILDSQRDALLDDPGIIHFFTGTENDAGKLLDLGFSFTFGGVITFARSYDGVIRAIPVDRILSETDAPYVAPLPYRGKRNEPAYVVEVVQKLAELKGISLEEMANQILENARRVLRIS
ncbi:TatD family deoxyribonuclease [Candidatus Parcubacteria bacterium]|nr:MAG: TatD family deoxyribonuclease [Candidatus Parcubacteria bacterium]